MVNYKDTHLDNYMNKIDHHSDRIIEFIFILLNQFIYDTDHKSQYLEFFQFIENPMGNISFD